MQIKLYRLNRYFTVYEKVESEIGLNPNADKTRFCTGTLSAFFVSIINKKFIDHLNKNNHMSVKQYSFRSSRSTGDVLTIIIESVMNLNKNTLKKISNFLMAFAKVWDRRSCYINATGMEQLKDYSQLSILYSQVGLSRSLLMPSPIKHMRSILASPHCSFLVTNF